MLKSCLNQCASCGQLLKVFRRTTTRWKNAHCRCLSSSQQGWDLSELACRCSHVTRAAGAEAQLCLCLAVTGKPGHSGLTHGQHCSISLGGKVPECPVGLHPEAGGSGCLQFVSLVCPQQLQKRDYQHPCLFPQCLLMGILSGNCFVPFWAHWSCLSPHALCW